jgi:hypothetical protein
VTNTNVIYKCLPGHHDWQPGKIHGDGKEFRVVASLVCRKCDASKLITEPDPDPKNDPDGSYVWIE